MKERLLVTVTYAQSIDGRIATKTGESQWISGEETLQLAQELRRDHHAIAVGVNTVLRDNPALTCRLPNSSSPLRVIFDTELRTPLDRQVITSATDWPTVFLCRAGIDEGLKAAMHREGVETVEIPKGEHGGLSIEEALTRLRTRGIETLLVEGGRGLITSFLHQGKVNRLIVVTAPIIIGEGISAVGELETLDLNQAIKTRVKSVRSMGRDVVWDLQIQ